MLQLKRSQVYIRYSMSSKTKSAPTINISKITIKHKVIHTISRFRFNITFIQPRTLYFRENENGFS